MSAARGHAPAATSLAWLDLNEVKVNVLTSTNKLASIAERVAAGAAVLDGAAPGWATGLDPQQFQVSALITRIDVADGVSLARYLRDGFAVELTRKVSHGLCLSLADFQDPAVDPCADLLDSWRDQVTRRQPQPTGGGGRR